MAKFKVLNPEGYPPKVSARGMAPSLDTLEGKRLPYVAVLPVFANIDDAVLGYLRRNYEALARDDGAMFQLYRRKGWAPVP